MSCTTCLQVKPIPLCINEIVIGTINNSNIDVKVKIKNESTGRIETIDAESDGDGQVLIDVSGIEFMENHYTISIHQPDDYSTDLDITIGTETGTCVDMLFENCNEEVESVELILREDVGYG